jgi:endo-1,4-beta-D-glucanase Y
MRLEVSSRAFCAVVSLCVAAAATCSAAANKPFPQHAGYTAHTLKPISHPQAEMDQDIRTSFDRWKANYLVQAGTEADSHPRYRVKESRDSAAATSSEAQGYGMVLTAMMAGYDANAQTEFDGLWEFFNDHRSTIDTRLMDHHVPASEAAESGQDNSSFQGDAQIAFALLQAEDQWGNAGRVNYHTQALSVIAAMKVREVGPNSHLPLLGDWVLTGDMSRYNENSVRTADMLPSHFRAFAAATGDASWLTILAAQQSVADYLLAVYSPKAGLLPDYIVWSVSKKRSGFAPAPAGFMGGTLDGLWSINAAKVPLSLGTDALLTQDDYSTRRSMWVGGAMRVAAKGRPMMLRAGYRLTGKPAPKIKSFSTEFIAPLAVAEMNDICPEALAWINNTYEAVRASNDGFNGDTISLLSMLVMTGNWWNP